MRKENGVLKKHPMPFFLFKICCIKFEKKKSHNDYLSDKIDVKYTYPAYLVFDKMFLSQCTIRTVKF